MVRARSFQVVGASAVSHGSSPVGSVAFINGSSEDFLSQLRRYSQVLAAFQATSPRRKNLVSLDRVWRGYGPVLRSTGLTADSLEAIVQFKLTRGQFRPLMRLVKGNTAAEIRDAWRGAMEVLAGSSAIPLSRLPQLEAQERFISSPSGLPRDAAPGQDAAVLPSPVVKATLDALCSLKGVGPATASYILAVAAPCWFAAMSDEALSASGCPRVYTVANYLQFNERVCQKAVEMGFPWSPEAVGMALWVEQAASGANR